MPLDPRWLPAPTRAVFMHLSSQKALEPFTLIGGSALALQIGHRLSQDLDFHFAGAALPQRALGAVLSAAHAHGFPVRDMLSPALLQQTRINHGADLHRWVQDWAIGGVKVSFSTFEGFADQMRAVMAFPRVDDAGTAFSVLGIDGLFAAKAALLSRRVRSRDLFDLKVLVDRHGYSLRQLFAAVRSVDPSANPDVHRDVLRGLIPLDRDDEGFAGIDVTDTVASLHEFFRKHIDAYEREEAGRIIDAARRP